MKYQKIFEDRPILWLLIPALVAFFITLVPTLKYHWPLGSDIFYHVHMAKLYLQQGLVYWDPLTSAPFGRPIFYPPLFHYLLLSLGYFFGDIFQAARFLQPFLSMSVVFSFSYVAYKLNKSILVGISAGFFIFFSLVFQRFMLSGPENLALIIFPLAIYGVYLSIENKNYRYAVLSGILGGLVLLTHLLSALCLFLVTSVYSLVISFKDKSAIQYLIIFFFCAFLVASIWWLPLIAKYGFIFNSNSDPPYMMSLFKYPKFFGVITLIAAFLGAILMVKRRCKQDILILTILITLLVLSNLYYLGIPVMSNRILTFALFPLVVMAGLGVEFLKTKFEEKQISRKIFYILLALVYSSAALVGYSMLADVDNGVPWLRTSDSQLDVAEWFQTYGDKKNVVIAYADPVIVAVSGQPVALGGYGQGTAKSIDVEKYLTGKANKPNFLEDKVGYVVLPLGMEQPPYTRLAYKNRDFAIYVFDS
jgi:asparagine N-glycosylation enzyme membrane subunit Stt3